MARDMGGCLIIVVDSGWTDLVVVIKPWLTQMLSTVSYEYALWQVQCVFLVRTLLSISFGTVSQMSVSTKGNTCPSLPSPHAILVRFKFKTLKSGMLSITVTWDKKSVLIDSRVYGREK